MLEELQAIEGCPGYYLDANSNQVYYLKPMAPYIRRGKLQYRLKDSRGENKYLTLEDKRKSEVVYRESYIYYIDCSKNMKGYVGCTTNSINKRWGQHKYLLKKGTHPNTALQEDWDKYGESAFSIIQIDKCPSEQQYECEGYHIKRLRTNDPELGYNASSQNLEEYYNKWISTHPDLMIF